MYTQQQMSAVGKVLTVENVHYTVKHMVSGNILNPSSYLVAVSDSGDSAFTLPWYDRRIIRAM